MALTLLTLNPRPSFICAGRGLELFLAVEEAKMNCKNLTSINGKITEITLSPFEANIVKQMAANVNIPAITQRINSTREPHTYLDNYAVGSVISKLFSLLEK